MKNKAGYLEDIKKFTVGDAPMPKEPKGCEVLIRIEYVGICGADLEMFEFGKVGVFTVDFPKIIGHEPTGVIEKIGPEVKDLKVGDNVALEPGVPCGVCEYCVTGKYNLCQSIIFKGAPPVAGCFQKYVLHPEQWTFKLPHTLSTKKGALIEPLVVGLHGAKQGEVTVGDTVVILGAGTIGLCTFNACKVRGASEIIVVDKIGFRLEQAKRMGAITIDVGSENIIERIKDISGNGADVVIETTGNKIALKQTPYIVKPGGTIVVIGLGSNTKVEMDFTQLLVKEVQIRTICRYRNLYPIAIKALNNKQISTDGIITKEFKLDKIQEAFEFTLRNKDKTIKTLIKID